MSAAAYSAAPLASEETVREYQSRLHAVAFARSERRVRRLKCLLDCGHWIDGSELYLYHVWRANSDPRGELQQRTECEPCARGVRHG